MGYLVESSRRAERDLGRIYEAIGAEESDVAFTWYRGLVEAILSLENSPGRCPVTPETNELRHLLYGHKPHIYRIIFRIIESKKMVEILHIRHGAMNRLEPAELKSIQRTHTKRGRKST